jgi:hypothetical protein
VKRSRTTLRVLALVLLVGSLEPVSYAETPAGESSPSTPDAGSTVSLADYRASLSTISEALDRGDVASARSEAERLSSARVEGGIVADRPLLTEIGRVSAPAEARRLGRRTAVVRDALDSLPGRAREHPAAPDRALFEAIRKSEQVDELAAGEAISLPHPPDSSFWKRLVESLKGAVEWIGARLLDLMDWLQKVWPSRKPDRSAGGLSLPVVVAILVATVVGILAIAAVIVLRRKAPATEVESSGRPVPAESEKDADPLSRGTSEWERLAEELARRGRIREAIRAWYHVVLTTLFGAGLLHHRKGITNWEYVSTLSPDLSWRSRFVELTRRFEREWYGSERSGQEELSEVVDEARGIVAAVRSRRESV